MLGQTLDDAAGEAFDKGARLLGLGYPGGPALSKLAAQGDREAFALPDARARVAGLDFSFAGLKTALLYKVRDLGEEERARRARRSRGLLPARDRRGADRARRARAGRTTGPRLAIGGGVAANRLLRERAAALGVPVHIPPPELCTDNAAMIASRRPLRRARRLSRATSMSTPTRRQRGVSAVTLYSRPGCHLCDDARAALERVRAPSAVRAARGATSSADDALHARYLERIPVVALDGEELFDFFVDEAALRKPRALS